MAGRGPAPKENRVRESNKLDRGVAVAAESECWAGEVPAAPEGLMPASTRLIQPSTSFGGIHRDHAVPATLAVAAFGR